MKKRLLKFDVIHPFEYLQEKQLEWSDTNKLSRKEYLNRLIKLRSNYSDFYTYHLNNLGWDAEEFFMTDPLYYEKVAKEVFGRNYLLEKLKWKVVNRLQPATGGHKWHKKIIEAYIDKFKPDVIFVRSNPLGSDFWKNFRKDALIVGRLSARLPFNWHPNHFDLIYTDQQDFKKFFELHDVKTILNKQGFDSRINDELINREKRFEVTFVGGLGTENFLKRTNFFNYMASQLEDFKWWGYWWKYGGDGRKLKDFPPLESTFQGITSGLEMFQKFKDSKINLNDYVDTANGIGFNQRMFEVMGTGSFLLTRDAPNFANTFPEDIFITYNTNEDCLDKIKYFLKHEKERDEIADSARKFIAENYSYQDIAEEFSKDLKKMMIKSNL